MITNDKTDFLIRFVVVHGGNRTVNAFGDRCYFTPRAFRSIMEMNEKMFRLDCLPFQFRMIKILLTDSYRRSNKNTYE